MLFPSGAAAQSLPLDSLVKRTSESFPDTARLKAFTQLADFYTTRNFDESYAAAQAGLVLANQLNDQDALANLTRLKGAAAYFKGQFDTAAVQYYQALEIAEKANLPLVKAAVFNNLGQLYRKTRDLDRALEHYDKAYALFEKMKDEDGMATILNESGVVFEYQKNYAEAVRRYKRSLESRTRSKDTVGIAYSLNFMGTAYTEAGQFKEAEQTLRACLVLRERIRDSFSLALTHTDLGYLYNKWSKPAQARTELLLSNNMAEAMHYTDLRLHNYQALAEVESKAGNPAAALGWLQQHNALKDSVYTVSKMKQIEDLEARYQNRAKTQELILQAAKIQQKNIVISALAIGVALLVALGYLIYKRRQAQAELNVQATRLEERHKATQAILEAEERERSRIAADLHDGVGQLMSAARLNLSGIGSVAFAQGKAPEAFEKALTLVDDSCQEIRSISHQIMPQVFARKGLERALHEFIQKIKHPDLQISLHVEGLSPNLSSLQAGVLYRMIQEGVNNVIKHAQASRLDISVIQDNQELSITLEDDGRGFDPQVAASGIGLQNLRSRVQFLEGELDIDSAPGRGTLLAIHLPIREN